MLQDLPEHFEENMEKWMKNFLILLTTDSKQLQVEVNVNFFDNSAVEGFSWDTSTQGIQTVEI